MPIDFSKIVATGNDFLFIDARGALSTPIKRADLAIKMCDRHDGAGADGLVFVEEAGARLRWDFYNSDGSHAEMCGNASRCMGRWAAHYLKTKSVEFDTVVGPVRAEEIDHEQVASHLDYLKLEFKELRYRLGNSEQVATFLNTGVPHAIVEVQDLSSVTPAQEDIAALRFHPYAGPRGTNVTFVQKLSADKFATVTYERGVEGFTLSCGTGVLAAAATALRKQGPESRAELKTPGGTLKVMFGPGWRGAVLEGSARMIYEGRFEL